MKEKIKCLSRLLEKTLEFKHDKYFTRLLFSGEENERDLDLVWLEIHTKEKYETEIILDFYYKQLSVKDIKVLADKIIKLLCDIEEGTDIENVKAKLPFRHNAFIDTDKFIAL